MCRNFGCLKLRTLLFVPFRFLCSSSSLWQARQEKEKKGDVDERFPTKLITQRKYTYRIKTVSRVDWYASSCDYVTHWAASLWAHNLLGLNSAKPFTAREAVHIKADTMLKGFNGVRLEKNITVHISRSTGTNTTTLSVVLWRVVAHTRSVPLPNTRR